MKFNFLKIALWTAILAVDLVIFLWLSFLLMSYEDNFDGSQGELWSLQSMSGPEKAYFISHNAWIVINIAALVFFLYKAFIRTKPFEKK